MIVPMTIPAIAPLDKPVLHGRAGSHGWPEGIEYVPAWTWT